jgi:23S rRNA (guanine745-N1)-methyltransferase
MPASCLVCPVKNCQQPLLRQDRRFLCPRGHSFDMARSGYVNLLQPQERRSKQPGDSAAAVQARRRLHDRGVSQPLLEGIQTLLEPRPQDLILDAGCGDGYFLGSIATQSQCGAIGVDISIPAIDAAARRYPDCQWLVANADRSLPCASASISAVVSITARMNAPEFRRVLAPGGRLLVAIPAEEDLIEFRRSGRERVDRTIETFAPFFTLDRQSKAISTVHLDASGIEDLGLSVYRPTHPDAAKAQQVSFALDLLLFRPK